MNKDYTIKLQAKLDDSAKIVTTLNKQIEDLENKIKNLEVNVSSSGSAKAEFKSLDEALNKVGLSSKELQDNFTEVKIKIDSAEKQVIQYKDALGQMAEVTKAVKNGEASYSVTKTKLNNELAKNVNTVSNLNAQYKTQDEVLKSLKVNLADFERISSTTDSNGNMIETWTNNSGKMLTMNGKLVEGNTKWTGSLKEVNNAVDKNAKQANKWQYSWTKAFQSFTTYMTVTTIFYQIVHTIEDMVDEVIELDSALVELQKVTDLTGESLQKFTADAYDAAEAVAKTGTEMVQAATEFAKAGYDENQTLKLGELALMYTNIADETVSAAEASEFMIAQMKAFNIEADEAIHIIDAVNEVANKYAVSSADIANNLGKSSAVMANAGNSYEQMIGLLTAGTEITRNASKVSNGLKTITLRLQGMDDEGSESLELVAQMETLFNKLNLSLYNTDGSLKNTYDILKSLAPVYKEATAAEKAYITETIAGKYQAQNAAAILNNFQTALEATETALNSEGSAMEENAKVVDSIQGKINSFNSAFEELSIKFIDSDLVKGIVELGTSLLKFANSDIGQTLIRAAELAVGFKVLWSTSSNLINSFKKIPAVFLSSSKSMKSFNDILLITKNRTQLLTLSEKTNKQALAATKTEMIALGISTDGVNTKKKAQIAINSALKASSLALNAVLMGGMLLISSLITAYQKHKQEEQEAIEQMISDSTDLENKMSGLDDTISRIEELRKVTDDSSSSYGEATSAREELNKIQQQLIKDYGLESDQIDLVNGSLEDQIKQLKLLRQQSASDYLVEHRTEIKDAENKVYGKNTKARSMNIGFNGTGFGSSFNVGRGVPFNGGTGISYESFNDQNKVLEEQNEEFEEYYNDYKEIMEKYGEIREHKNELDGSVVGVTFTTKSVDESKKALEEWGTYLEDNKEHLIGSGIISEDEWQANSDYVSSQLKDIEDDFGAVYQALDEAQKQALTAHGFDFLTEELQNFANEGVLTEDKINELIATHDGLDGAMENSGLTVEQLLKQYQNYDKVVDEVGNNLGDDFTNRIQEMVKSNDLSYDSFNKLLEEFPELQTQLDKYKMSIGDYADKISSLVNEQTSWTVAVQNFNKEIDTLQSALGTLNAAQEEYNENGYLSIDTLQSLLTLNGEYLSYLIDENGNLNLNKDAFKELTKAKINDMIATEEQRHYNAVLDISNQKLNNTVKKSIGWFQNLWNVIKGGNTSVEETARTLEELEKEIEEKGDDAQQAALKAENETYEGRMAILRATLKGVNESFDKAMGYSSSSSSSSSSKEWWETVLSSLKDQFKYNEITVDEYIRGLDALLGMLGQGTDAWKQINEELQKQRLSKIEDDYKRGTISLDKYISKLRELIKAYKQGTDAWNELADKIKKGLQDKAEAQKEDLDTAEEAAVRIIEDEIEKLNELKEEQEEYYDKLIADKEKANEETEREIELTRLQEALANAKNQKIKRIWREGIGKKSADLKDNYIGQMLEIVKTEVRLNLRWCVYG